MATSKASKKSKEPSALGKGYLLAYNFIQVLGWSYLLYGILDFYVNHREGKLWTAVKTSVVIFQNAAFLEIINAYTGLVPSNVIITVFQVFSRLIVVNGVLLATPTGPLSPGLPLCLLAWSITEIIRYLYYALNILNKVPYLLIWARYTFFIALYPLGVTGELLCFYWAQAYVQQHNSYSYSLPNAVNFTFSYHYLMLFLMFLYIPLFPQMYLHMFAQRRKILGGKQTIQEGDKKRH